jgi:hypothetical protein
VFAIFGGVGESFWRRALALLAAHLDLLSISFDAYPIPMDLRWLAARANVLSRVRSLPCEETVIVR